MAIHSPLTGLAAPLPGISSDVDKAAIESIAGRVDMARAVVEAVEPLIVQNAIDRIVANATEEWQYTVRIHYTNMYRKADDGDPMDYQLAEITAYGLNHNTSGHYRSQRGIDRAEVARRTILHLRDGSTLIGPWAPHVKPPYPGGQ